MRVLVAALFFVGGVVTALATVAVHPYGWGFLLGAAATLVALVALGARLVDTARLRPRLGRVHRLGHAVARRG